MFVRPKLAVALVALVLIGFSAVRCTVSPDDLLQGEGTLRVLITDKPYPLDLIEEANITITRIDVRRSEVLPVCSTDADCLDDVFCNGVESCVEGECVNGQFPCAEGEFCDEETETCMSSCESDAQCDDSVYCNGIETCDSETGECLEGVEPCAEGEECDEETDSCVIVNAIEGPDGEGAPGEDAEGEDPDDVDADEEDGDDEHSSWVTIFEGARPFNLLDLQNGRTDLLAESTLDAGTYTQMRLVVTEGELKLNDVAEPYLLRVPSGEQTGIKLHFTFDVLAGQETVLLLDVDLTQAFRPIPGGQIEDPSTIRTFHFTPSVAMKLIDIIESGDITGVVVDESAAPLENVIVTVFGEDGVEVTSGGTDADGSFTLIGLPAGTYDVELSLGGFEDVAVPDVVVNAGETTDIGTITMTAPTTP